jgi:hypothetical protein
MHRSLLPLVVIGSVATLAVAATLLPSSFLGAGPGTDVPFEPIALPQSVTAPHGPVSAGPGLLQTLAFKSAFTPSQEQLMQGDTVITTEKQMREVWHLLFAEPYDPTLFDFGSSFVVLMGGGQIANGTFDISAVEVVQAEYSQPGGPGGDTTAETFLSVTSTTFLSGVQPEDPPSSTWRLSAVRIPRDQLDDVVFRRNLVLGV